MFTPSIIESQAFTALRAFLTTILPAGIPIVQGLGNQVPEPENSDFVVMTPLFRLRLATNIVDYTDTAMVGAISGNTLTITSVIAGALAVGDWLFGEDSTNTFIITGTQITAFGTGTGGIGTYTVNNAQTILSTTIQAGTYEAMQPTEFDVQLDVHGPNSGDNSQTISTLFRSDYAASQFAAQSPPVAVPLYADDPKQLPFINGANQYEERWVITARMEINPVVDAPQQFADVLTPTVIPADVIYPLE